MARARGANALVALAFASTYGEVPLSGFYKIAFSALNLGEEQGLIASDLLGFGREPLPPSEDVINNDGDASVPVDVRLFGLWLKLVMGAPVTTQGVAATGAVTFAANPAVNDTITIGGQAFTFKAAITAANQILIGATLADTVKNAVWALNASAVAGVAAASYTATSPTNNQAFAGIKITHDTVGTGGNAFTLAASAATVSGATLAGGATTGPYNHVFTSGANNLPDAAIEITHPEVPSSSMNYGVAAASLALPFQRSGNLSATIGLVAQGTKPSTDASAAGTPTELVIERFSQFTGLLARAGVPLGEIVSGALNINNNPDKAENIRFDGRIDGVDAGALVMTLQFVSRYKTRELLQLAEAGDPIDLSMSWTRQAGQSLTFRMLAGRLPRKARLPISGPGGVQQTYEIQAQRDPASGHSLVVTLVNDVASYA